MPVSVLPHPVLTLFPQELMPSARILLQPPITWHGAVPRYPFLAVPGRVPLQNASGGRVLLQSYQKEAVSFLSQAGASVFVLFQ